MDREGGPLVFGRNAVREAMKASMVGKLFVLRGTKSGIVRELLKDAVERGVPVSMVEADTLYRMTGGGRHQGVAALVAKSPTLGVEEMWNRLSSIRIPFLLALDGIEDPRNLGAVIRSAEAAGVDGIFVSSARSCGITGIVWKSSAGAVAHVRLCFVRDLKRVLLGLKERGVWVFGASADGDSVYHEADLSGPVCIVAGGEGRGIRRSILSCCDAVLRIPMIGKTTSLNVSVAASILLFEVRRQRSLLGDCT